MGNLPPLPTWQELHPLIIHFPIALLLVAPVFIVLGAVLRKDRSRMFLVSALIVMLLGTAFLYLATQTGQAASGRHQLSPHVTAVLSEHRALATDTRELFTVVTAIFGLLLLLTLKLRIGIEELSPALPLAFLSLYALAVFLLVSAAYHGGQLVHEFGL